MGYEWYDIREILGSKGLTQHYVVEFLKDQKW